MSLDPQLLEILVCPNDRGDLDYREDESVLVCTTCGYRYPIRDDIPVMLIDEAEKPDEKPAKKPARTARNLTAAAGDDRPRRRRGHHADRPRRHAGGHHRDAPARADRIRGRERGARDAAGRRRHLHRVRRDGRIGDRGRRLAHVGPRPSHRSGRRQPGAGAAGLLRSPHARDLFVVLREHGRDAGRATPMRESADAGSWRSPPAANSRPGPPPTGRASSPCPGATCPGRPSA